jgi:methyl-accepting chemotaxis protein
MTVKAGAAITICAEFGAVRMAHDAVPVPCSIAPMRLIKHVAVHRRHDKPNLPSSARPAGDENSLVQPDPLNAEMAALATSNVATTHRLAQEVDAFYHNRLWLLIGLVTIGILTSIALTIAVVVFAITRLIQTMMTLASGSTEITVPAADRGDEIGDMARAVQVFLNQALAVRGLTTQIMENIRRVANAASQASSAVSQVSDGSNIQLNALKQSSGALEQSTQATSEVARGTSRRASGRATPPVWSTRRSSR